jgi:hypothetical protein
LQAVSDAIEHTQWLSGARGMLHNIGLAGIAKGADGANDSAFVLDSVELKEIFWRI